MRVREYRAMFDLEAHHWWYDGMREVTRSILDRHVELSSGSRVLDVGCGTGYSLYWLKHALGAEETFGIDASPNAAAFWNVQSVRSGAIASVTNLPFRSNEFDLITCFDVLYQLDPNDTLAAIAEVRGVLRHGGFLYIREPAYDWIRGSHDVAVATRHRYTLPELEEILTTAGFLIRHATYANSLLLGAAIAYRFATRFKSGDDSDLRRVPGWLNRILAATLRFEAGIVDRFRSPAGLSAIVLAEKG